VATAVRQPRLIDRLLLSTSYVILIAVVVFGVFWLGFQFNDQSHQRCKLAKVQLEVITSVYISFRNQVGANPNDPEIVKLLNDANKTLMEECKLEVPFR